MRKLRRFFAMLILATALVSAVRAEGPINCPGIVQQPAQGQSMTADTSTEPDAVTRIILFFVDAAVSLI